MTMGTAPKSSARDRTRSDLYQLISSQVETTRSDLVEATGLSRSTVNQAVARLIADGVVEETELKVKGRGSGSGRRPTKLRVVTTDEHVVGIDFGHFHVRVAVADVLGRQIGAESVELDVDLQAHEAMDVAATMLARLREEHAVTNIATVVAGVPGPLDSQTGLVHSPTILSSWVGLAPAAELARRIGVPVHVENDAVLGAYGELVRGAGRFYDHFLYVKASDGIGAGLVINRVPYRGGTGLAGEIGHTRLPGRTEMCRCGNSGCLEAAISVKAIRDRIIHTHPTLANTKVTLTSVDDAIVDRILEEAGRALGGVLADLCNLLNPLAVIVGGEIGAAGPALIQGVRSSIDRQAQPATAAVVEVLPAALGIDAELTGAVHFAASMARR
ncbi:MAG: ROK family transcriptional regulator [Brevundimonas sp.]